MNCPKCGARLVYTWDRKGMYCRAPLPGNPLRQCGYRVALLLSHERTKRGRIK